MKRSLSSISAYRRTGIRFTAALLSAIMLMQPLLADVSQADLWKDRRAAAAPRILASLPATPIPALSSASRIPLASLPAHTGQGLPFASAISPELGRVSRVINGSGQRHAPVLFIQDVHGSLEAQKNIRNAVAGLLAQTQTPVLALEGAFGPIDLARYRNFSRRDVIASSADFLFSELRVSGPAHAALAATRGEVWGIDDADLHARNVDAYLAASKRTAATKAVLSNASGKLEVEKQSTFSLALRTFDHVVTEFRGGRAALSTYAEALAAADDKGALTAFREAARLEGTIDFKRVEAERARLLERLVARTTPAELTSLAANAVALRTGTMSPADFYRAFGTLCEAHDISLSASPAFEAYARYVALAESIDGTRLWSEFASLERRTYEKLARTPAESELVARSRAAGLAEKLSDFSLTPEEWAEWKAGARAQSPTDLNAFEDFYRAAELRDGAMAANVARLPDAPMILVAGGFHAHGLADALAATGRTVIVWTPSVKVADAGTTAKALSVFAREKTPLEELFQGQKLFLADLPFRGLTDLPPLVAALSPDPQAAIDELLPESGTVARVSQYEEVAQVALTRNGKTTETDVRHRGLRILGSKPGKSPTVGRIAGDIYERLARRSTALSASFASAVGGAQEFVARVALGGVAGLIATALAAAGATTAAVLVLPAFALVYALVFATVEHPYGRFMNEISVRRLSGEHRIVLAAFAAALGMAQVALFDPTSLTFLSLTVSSGLLGLAHAFFSIMLATVGLPFSMAGQAPDPARIDTIIALRDAELPAIRAKDEGQFLAATAAFRGEAAIGELTTEKLGTAVALFSSAVERALLDPRTDPEIAAYVGGMPTRRQIEAAISLLGKRTIAGLRPSEGKTLTVVLASFFQISLGRRVEVHDWNSALTARDAQVSGAVLSRLGLKVSAFVGTRLTEFDIEGSRSRRIQPHLANVTSDGTIRGRRDAIRKMYADSNVVYGPYDTMIYHWMDDWFGLTNGNLHPAPQPDWVFVEESDTPLLDTQGDPLVIARRVYTLNRQREEMYKRIYRFAENLELGRYFLVERNGIRFRSKKKLAELARDLEMKLGEAEIRGLSGFLREQSVKDLLMAALEARYLFRRNVNYFVLENKVVIRNHTTGEVKRDQKWARGIHTFIEIKESRTGAVPIQNPTVSDVAMTAQSFYNELWHWSGVAGVLDDRTKKELDEGYKASIVDFPATFESKLDVRPPQYFRTEAEKIDAIVEQVVRLHASQRPILINASSPQEATDIADRLKTALPPSNLLSVIDGRDEKRDAAVWERMGVRNAVTVAAQVASRGHEIKIPEELYEPVNVPGFGPVGGLVVVNTQHAVAARLEAQVWTRAARRGRLGLYLQFDHADGNDLLTSFAPDRQAAILARSGNPDPVEFREAIDRSRDVRSELLGKRYAALESRYNLLILAHGQFAELARGMVARGEEPIRFFNLSAEILNRANAAIQVADDDEFKAQLERLREESRYMSGVLNTPGLIFAEHLPLTTRLRLLRRTLNMKQSELATAVGISRVTYRRMEAGLSVPKPVTLRKLLRYFTETANFSVSDMARVLGQPDETTFLRATAGLPVRDVLRFLRESRWMTREDLGKLTDPRQSENMVLKWETGYFVPSEDEIRQIVFHFVEHEGYSLRSLLGAFGIPSPEAVLASLQGRPLREIFQGLRGGRSVQEVADGTNSTVQAVWKWEKGTRPQDATLREIINYYFRQGYDRDALRRLFGLRGIAETQKDLAGKDSGTVMREARETIPIGKNEMAGLVGFSLPTITKWEKQGLTVKNMRRVAAILKNHGFSENAILRAAGIPEFLTFLPGLVGRPMNEIITEIREVTGEDPADVYSSVQANAADFAAWEAGTPIPRQFRVRLVAHWSIHWPMPAKLLRQLFHVPHHRDLTASLAGRLPSEILDLLETPYDLTDSLLADNSGASREVLADYRAGRPVDEHALEELSIYFSNVHRFDRVLLMSALTAANGRTTPVLQGPVAQPGNNAVADTTVQPDVSAPPNEGGVNGVWPVWAALHRWALNADNAHGSLWRLKSVVAAIGFVEEWLARPALGILAFAAINWLGFDPLAVYSVTAVLYALTFASRLVHPAGYVGRSSEARQLTKGERGRLFVLALTLGVIQFAAPLPWWQTYLLLGALHAAFNLWAVTRNQVLGIVPHQVNLAAEALLSDASTEEEKIQAIDTIASMPSTIDLSVLNKAITKYEANERIVLKILEAFVTLRKTGVLNRREIKTESLRGVIWHALRDFGYPRDGDNYHDDRFRLVAENRGHRYRLEFKFPLETPFDEIDKVIQRMQELYNQKNSRISPTINKWTDPNEPPNTRGHITIEIPLSHSNLTDVQRMFGTLEYMLSPRGRYRAYLPTELANKLEELAWEFLDGLDPNDPDYVDLVKFIYGDGTEDQPGLLTALRNQSRYGSKEFIPVESNPEEMTNADGLRSDARISLKNITDLTWNLAIFTHFIPEDVQRWGFLARAAGPHKDAAYLKGLLYGLEEDDFMLFVSNDTLGFAVTVPLRLYLGALIGVIGYEHPETGRYEDGKVANFTGLQLAMEHFLRKRYLRQDAMKWDKGRSQGVVRYRKATAWYDETGYLNEYLPVYDRVGAGAVKIAQIHRIQKPNPDPVYGVDYVDPNPEIRSMYHVLPDGSRGADFTDQEKIGLEIPLPRADQLTTYVMNAIYRQARSTPFLDKLKRTDALGNPITPKVCIVDEVGNGTFDFLIKAVIEWLSRMDDSEIPVPVELEKLRRKSAFKLTAAEVARWKQLEDERLKLLDAGDAIDVSIFIGRQRNVAEFGGPVEGYPSLQIGKIMAELGKSLAEAQEAVEGTTMTANQIPHLYEINKAKVPGTPILGDIPIRYEKPAIQVGAYLTTLKTYNGLVRYYRTLFDRLASQPMIALLKKESTPAAVREQILSSLDEFSFRATLITILKESSKDPKVAAALAPVIPKMFRHFFEEPLVFDETGPIAVRYYEWLRSESTMLNVLAGDSHPFPDVRAMAKKAKELLELNKARIIVLTMSLPDYRKLTIKQIARLRAAGYYPAPVISTSELEADLETKRLLEAYNAGSFRKATVEEAINLIPARTPAATGGNQGSTTVLSLAPLALIVSEDPALQMIGLILSFSVMAYLTFQKYFNRRGFRAIWVSVLESLGALVKSFPNDLWNRLFGGNRKEPSEPTEHEEKVAAALIEATSPEAATNRAETALALNTALAGVEAPSGLTGTLFETIADQTRTGHMDTNRLGVAIARAWEKKNGAHLDEHGAFQLLMKAHVAASRPSADPLKQPLSNEQTGTLWAMNEQNAGHAEDIIRQAMAEGGQNRLLIVAANEKLAAEARAAAGNIPGIEIVVDDGKIMADENGSQTLDLFALENLAISSWGTTFWASSRLRVLAPPVSINMSGLGTDSRLRMAAFLIIDAVGAVPISVGALENMAALAVVIGRQA